MNVEGFRNCPDTLYCIRKLSQTIRPSNRDSIHRNSEY